jgi:hypothetical protein
MNWPLRFLPVLVVIAIAIGIYAGIAVFETLTG